MLWLAVHMWGLLAAAYLLGIFSWWLLSRKPAQEPDYEGARVYDEKYSDSNNDVSIEKNQRYERQVTNDYSNENDYNSKPVRTKIYENQPQENDTITTDNLSDLPDLDTQSPVNVNEKKGENNYAIPAKISAPKLFSAPMQGAADDLKRIKGVGPTLERTLNATGVYYFEQIAAWTDEEIAWIDNRIDFPGRVTRERWVAQASVLADDNITSDTLKKIAEDQLTTTQDLNTRHIIKEDDAVTKRVDPTPKPVALTSQRQLSENTQESMLDRLMAQKKADSNRA